MLTIKCKARDLTTTVQAALLKLETKPVITRAQRAEIDWQLWWVCKGARL